MMQLYQADKKFSDKYGKLQKPKLLGKSSSMPKLQRSGKNCSNIIRKSMYILPNLRNGTVSL